MSDHFADQSPYSFAANNPIFYTDNDGESPFSWFAKKAAKLGLKKVAKEYIEDKIVSKLKGYIKYAKEYKDELGDFAQDATDLVEALDDSWFEILIEFIPVAGDIYSGFDLARDARNMWKGLKRLENKVDKFTKKIDKKLRAKEKETGPGEGIIYLRTDRKTGKQYVGSAKNQKRYDKRQYEHGKDKYKFKVLESGVNNKNLRHREETHIRQKGGLEKDGGTLENKVHARSEKKYKKGSEDKGLEYEKDPTKSDDFGKPGSDSKPFPGSGESGGGEGSGGKPGTGTVIVEGF